MTTAVGAGTLLQVGLAVASAPESLPLVGAETFRTIAYKVSVTPPAFVKKTIEQPTLNDGTLQFGGGLEAQEVVVTFVRNFGDVPHEDVFTDARNQASQFRNIRIRYADAGQETWDFRGFCSTYEVQELTSEQAVLVRAVFKVSGNITVTP